MADVPTDPDRELVRVEKPRPHTTVITMNRPERMNSMAFQLMVPLHEAFETVAPGSMDGSVKGREIGRIVERWGIAPERVAYVGDMPSDIVEARSAGVVSVAAAWKPGAHTEELAALGPDVLIRDQEAMAAWIDSTVAGPGISSRRDQI